MPILWFDVCAIFVTITIMVNCHGRKKIPLRQNKLFSILSWLILVSAICDFTVNLWIANPINVDSIQFTLTKITNYIYFFTRNGTAFVFVLYIISVLNLPFKGVISKTAIYAPCSVAFALIATNPFHHFIFYFDANGIYCRGRYMIIFYILSVSYLFLILYLTTRYRQAIPHDTRLAFYAFVIVALFAIILQYQLPRFQVELFGTSLCLLMIYLTMERSETVLDVATGFFNKFAFLTALSVRFRQETEFTIILVTLHDFSFFEKSMGLQITNRLFIQVLEFLKQTSKVITCYRVSDGQLCVLTNENDPAVTEFLLNAFRERSKTPWQVDDLTVPLLAEFTLIRLPSQAETPEVVLDLIDVISIRIQSGNFDDPCAIEFLEAQRKRAIQHIVKTAIDDRLLEVYYQPIYFIKDKCFPTAEALLRMHHPTLGTIPPDEFIPIAEQNGAIIRIGRFVLESVCQFLSTHNLAKLGIEFIEVNLSVVECLQDDLVEKTMKTLAKYGVDPRQINFEITETAVVCLSDSAMHNIEVLVEKGFHFSLDDFGSGFSNIVRMLTLPMSIVKIDKSLIQTCLDSNWKNMHIVVDSTVRMLIQLQKTVLAEGIETPEQANYLIMQGCNYIQGYYYARPMPEQEFLAFLEMKNMI